MDSIDNKIIQFVRTSYKPARIKIKGRFKQGISIDYVDYLLNDESTKFIVKNLLVKNITRIFDCSETQALGCINKVIKL